jgi:lipopolysaccharide export LptBFGC system permease protein LptF
LIPWYTQLNKIELLTGRGLQQVAPSLTNLLLYLYVGYPVCVLICLALSIWLGAKHHKYSALLVSTLPLIYFGFMVIVAKKLVATVAARVQGRLAQELISTVPFQYFLPAPLILPGFALKGIFRRDV